MSINSSKYDEKKQHRDDIDTDLNDDAISNHIDEDEELDSEENFLGNLILKTRSQLFRQLQRVLYAYINSKTEYYSNILSLINFNNRF